MGMTPHLGALWNVVTSYEGGGTPKQIWVSEYGWEASVVGVPLQAARDEGVLLRHPFDDLDMASLRQSIGVVMQDTVMMPGTTTTP